MHNVRKLKIQFFFIILGVFLTASLGYISAISFKDFGNFFEKKGIVDTQDKTTTLEEPSTPSLPANNLPSIDDLESRVTTIAESANKSVVSVIITKDIPNLEQYYTNPFGDSFGSDPFFQQFFGNGFNLQVPQYRQNGTTKQEVGAGTGFIISSDGYILTNKHVVDDEKADYTVLTNDGDKISAKVLARHPILDLAIIKIDKKGLTPLRLGNSDKTRVGQFVIAIGNALGEFRNTVSFGVISGLSRSISALGAPGGAEDLDELLQTDAAINRGNSGGPLINMRGEVIGINTAIAQGAQSVGFSIPINKAKKMIDDIEQFGKISYPFLGVRYTMVNKLLKDKNDLSVDYGALVARGETSADLAVIPGSPADKAGLLENDIILELNGKKISYDNNLSKQLANFNPGDTVKLKILRKGKEITLPVTLEEKK